MSAGRGLTAAELFAQAAAGGVGGGAPAQTWRADDLLRADFPEPRWAVPGVLPAGLTLLVGPPKIGKSWLALGLAVAVAAGSSALGAVPCEPGGTLYYALEDNWRRLQDRLVLLLGGEAAPRRLQLRTRCSPLDAGGAAEIEGWLKATPDARLMIIDVLARVRPAATGSSTQYAADYAAVRDLKAIADTHGVAIVVVHHSRKQSADDFVDMISGTGGLAGAADAVAVLRRCRGQADAALLLTGRDVPEKELALRFAASAGSWSLMEGAPEDHLLPPGRAAALRLLREGEALSPRAVAEALKITHDNARQLLRRMALDGQIRACGDGRYEALQDVDSDTRSQPSQPSQVSQVAASERESASEPVTEADLLSQRVSQRVSQVLRPVARSEAHDRKDSHSHSLSPLLPVTPVTAVTAHQELSERRSVSDH